MKILLVDDDPEILEIMADFLSAEGFHTVSAQSAFEAKNLLKSESDISCILLDVMLPKQSGFEFCRIIREEYDIPILFLTARHEDTDKVRGLNLGADDYIVKSATPIEITARIQAVMRRYHKTQTNTTSIGATKLTFKELTIDEGSREVRVNGNAVHLTKTEFDILYFLAQKPNQVFTYEQIYHHIWEELNFDLHTVRVHVSKVRDKLKKASSNTNWIETVWGVGYKFTGDKK